MICVSVLTSPPEDLSFTNGSVFNNGRSLDSCSLHKDPGNAIHIMSLEGRGRFPCSYSDFKMIEENSLHLRKITVLVSSPEVLSINRACGGFNFVPSFKHLL